MGLRHLLVFTNDLRLDDNQTLNQAAKQCDELICLFCIDSAWEKTGRYQSKPMGEHRKRFLMQSLMELDVALAKHGQRLIIRQGNPADIIGNFIQQHHIARVFYSNPVGWNERQVWQYLQKQNPETVFKSYYNATLFDEATLPFSISDLPPTFSKFRKRVEKSRYQALIQCPESLPEPMFLETIKPTHPSNEGEFGGGEQAGKKHLLSYFKSQAASSYKKTRNALDDWRSSTKSSPWLAMGCISPRQIVKQLAQYERQYGANESTQWIEFELLWREYFQWYALAHGVRLFKYRGIKTTAPLNSFYPSHFLAWCTGQTPYPIVNACMNQLNTTGYMSNRGRQIVASCFVHELGLDWRYGAAYFEQQLIDYDVGSNWGNWQYLAGVGADPRGWRQFDLNKQTHMYDADGSYIKKWQGAVKSQIVEMDAADWPLPQAVASNSND